MVWRGDTGKTGDSIHTLNHSEALQGQGLRCPGQVRQSLPWNVPLLSWAVVKPPHQKESSITDGVACRHCMRCVWCKLEVYPITPYR